MPSGENATERTDEVCPVSTIVQIDCPAVDADSANENTMIQYFMFVIRYPVWVWAILGPRYRSLRSGTISADRSKLPRGHLSLSVAQTHYLT